MKSIKMCLLSIDFQAYFALRAPDDTKHDDLPERRFFRPLESK